MTSQAGMASPGSPVILRATGRVEPRWRGLVILAIYVAVGVALLFVPGDPEAEPGPGAILPFIAGGVVAIAGLLLVVQLLLSSGALPAMRFTGARGRLEVRGLGRWGFPVRLRVAPGKRIAYSVRPKHLRAVPLSGGLSGGSIFTMPPVDAVAWSVSNGRRYITVWMCVMPDRRMIDDFERAFRAAGIEPVRDD